MFQEYTNDPVAIRTNCAGGTNVIVSTPHKINVNMVCNGKQSSNFEISGLTMHTAESPIMKIYMDVDRRGYG